MHSLNMEGAAGQQVGREARPLWLDPPEVVQQHAASRAHLLQVRLPAWGATGMAPCRNPLRHRRVSLAFGLFFATRLVCSISSGTRTNPGFWV